MDPKQLQLILFAEQMAEMAVKTIGDLRGILTGSSTKSVDDILADADANYQSIIDKRPS